MSLLGLINGFIASASPARSDIRAITGQQNHYVADCTSANLTIPDAYRGCRYVEVDVAGIIKVTYLGDNGAPRTEVKQMSAGERWLVPNVTIVYRYYVDTTSCTSQVYTDAGALVTGIKLRF